LTPSVQAACPALPDPNITFTGDAVCTPGGMGPPGDDLRAGHVPGQAGAISVTGGAVIQLDSAAPAGPNNGPFMVIGRQPTSVGNAVISGFGSAIQLNGNDHGASAQVGREGTGSITIQNGGALRVFDTGATPGSGVAGGESVFVGRDGGFGTLTLNAGTLTVDSNSGAFLFLGEGAGTGIVNATNGSTITLRDRDPGLTSPGATAVVGRNVTGTLGTSSGTLILNGSTLSVQSDNGTASIAVAREAGTLGTMTATGSTITIESTRNAGILIGRDGASGSNLAADGTLTITNSTLTVTNSGTAAGTSAFLQVGESGTGRLTLEGAGTTATFTGREAVANVGRNAGATGTLTVRDGATLTFDATTASAGIFVGRFGGATGSMTVANGASVDIIGPTAFLQIGREAGALGTAQITGGSNLSLNGTNIGALIIGRDAGGLGSLTVTGGSQVTVAGTDSLLRVGGAATDVLNAGTGTLTISGAGSLVSAGRVIVGAPVSLAGSTSDGGTVIVSNGGTLQAGEVRIGTSGLVGGSGGTIIGSVILDGGTLAPGLSPGILNIVGDLTVLDGILKIEIGGTGAGQYDVLNVSGTTMITGGTVLFEFIDGFAPTAGQTFDFFSGPNAPIIADDVTFAVGGLQAGFQFDLGPSFTFVALNDGVPTTAVPEPASAALLLAGLLGLAALRRRAA
jgi:T5SS/PEP-CTERM-associated repeat protein